MALSAGIITGNKPQEALRESVTNGSLRPVTKPSPSPDLSNHLPDEPGPTKRYCNLAMELGAQAPGQWAVVVNKIVLRIVEHYKRDVRYQIQFRCKFKVQGFDSGHQILAVGSVYPAIGRIENTKLICDMLDQTDRITGLTQICGSI